MAGVGEDRCGRNVTGTALPRRFIVQYALGSLGTGVFTTVPSVLLLFYCTETLHLSAATASAIVFLPKAWAIVFDPAIGALSDRTQSRFGRRAPFLLAGALGVMICFVLLFHMSGLPAVVVAALYFLMTSFYSVFAVPYLAIPAEASPVAAERETLLTWRMAFAMAGILIGAGVAPHLVAWAGGGAQGYGVMAWIVGLTCGLFMLGSLGAARPVRDSRDLAPSHERAPAVAEILRVLRAREFGPLLAAYLLQLTGIGVLSSTTSYFVRDVLARPEEDAGSLLGLLVIVTALAMPVCGWAMRRFDPWRLMMCAAALYAVLSLCLGIIGPLQNFTVVALLYAALGVPFAGLQLVPFALLAHIAHRESTATGRASEGLFTGVWTAAEKLGLALGPAIGGIGLSLIGFTGGATLSAGIADDLRWIPAAGPCLFMLLSLVVLRRAIGARS